MSISDTALLKVFTISLNRKIIILIVYTFTDLYDELFLSNQESNTNLR